MYTLNQIYNPTPKYYNFVAHILERSCTIFASLEDQFIAEVQKQFSLKTNERCLNDVLLSKTTLYTKSCTLLNSGRTNFRAVSHQTALFQWPNNFPGDPMIHLS